MTRIYLCPRCQRVLISAALAICPDCDEELDRLAAKPTQQIESAVTRTVPVETMPSASVLDEFTVEERSPLVRLAQRALKGSIGGPKDGAA